MVAWLGVDVVSMSKHPPSSASPLHGADLCAFLVTTDAARCRAFYCDKLGFAVAFDDDWAVGLDAFGRKIRVQKMQQHTPRPYTVLGWNVADIEGTVTQLGAVGVPCKHYGFPFQDARGIASFPDGARVAWFEDPDGNVLSVAQMPR